MCSIWCPYTESKHKASPSKKKHKASEIQKIKINHGDDTSETCKINIILSPSKLMEILSRSLSVHAQTIRLQVDP
jgi:hypothetical protein